MDDARAAHLVPVPTIHPVPPRLKGKQQGSACSGACCTSRWQEQTSEYANEQFKERLRCAHAMFPPPFLLWQLLGHRERERERERGTHLSHTHTTKMRDGIRERAMQVNHKVMRLETSMISLLVDTWATKILYTTFGSIKIKRLQFLPHAPPLLLIKTNAFNKMFFHIHREHTKSHHCFSQKAIRPITCA